MSSRCRLCLGGGIQACIRLRTLSIPLLLQVIELGTSDLGSSRRLDLLLSLLIHYFAQPQCELISFSSKVTACGFDMIKMRLPLGCLIHHVKLRRV